MEAYAGHVHSSTLRVEMTRLGTLLDPAVLASGAPHLMVGWTRSRWGAGDLEMWE